MYAMERQMDHAQKKWRQQSGRAVRKGLAAEYNI